jgi:2-dehydro-3-deoxygalactonokinase
VTSAARSAPQAPALLAIDWGTTALRGALLAADGTVLAEQAAPRGLLSIAPGGWAAAFEAEFGAWRSAHPHIPTLMAGMVGSRQGWAEAPYCPCPAGLDDLAERLLWLQPGRLAIVPGLSTEPDGPPDVMRGEETQVFGALQGLGMGLADATLVLPGTHSKWVTVQAGRITGLATHMTGECYALLRQQSILARTLPADDDDWQPEAFDRGVAQAQRPGGLLHHLFGVRALALFGQQSPAEGASYLSGLLIGEELRAAAPAAGSRVVVVGSPALTSRYQRALGRCGVVAQAVGAEATWRGLAALAARLPAAAAGR